MTPPRSPRRALGEGELVAVVRLLADGVPLPLCAQRYGVTPGTLRRALLEEAWRDWCHRHGVAGVALPEGHS
jgi:hypothetical protein